MEDDGCVLVFSELREGSVDMRFSSATPIPGRAISPVVTGGGTVAAEMAPARRRRWRRAKEAIAASIPTPAAVPTPIPAFAPGVSPDRGMARL